MTLQLPTQKAEDFKRLASLLQNLATSRRGLLVAPFIAALPASLISDPAQAIDPNETPGQIQSAVDNSCVSPCGPAILVTHGQNRKSTAKQSPNGFCLAQF